MAADKQLIVVLEGTANMGVHWKTIVSDYLEKIVRKFRGNDAVGQINGATTGAETFELGLVQFNTKSYSGAMLMRSGWTRDMDRFLEWLSCMRFSGGGVDDPETAEGLADALMMFAVPENGYQTDQNLKGKRHCILVTASNPCLLPAPVYRPNIKDSGPPPLLSDAETVARWFGQCSVSLSVICSRKLPKVRALYEAANRNHTSEDPPVHVQHPRFLVLVSESFAEARAALNLPGLAPAQDPVKSLDPNLGASSSSQPDQPARKELDMSQENIAPTNLDFVEQSVAASLASLHFIPGSSVFPNAATMTMLGYSKYVKLWKGSLHGQKQGKAVLISKIEVYRTTAASSMLAADWPDSLHVTRLIPHDQINHENAADGVLLLVRVLDNHPFFYQLQEKKLCAVADLPSQTVFLSVSYKATLLIGTLLPGHVIKTSCVYVNHNLPQGTQKKSA